MRLTAERLREVLHYDPENGQFTWLISRRGHIKAGSIAGCLDDRGYRGIKIDQILCRAHRLAWLYMTGAWPDCEIDHINQLKYDNRFSNLRAVNRRQNEQNKLMRSDNKSGFKGVSLHKASGKWQAFISVRGKSIYLGKYDDPLAAHKAYCSAAKLWHTHNAAVDPARRLSELEMRPNV